MRGPSLNETFASKGGQGIGNCGHTSARVRETDHKSSPTCRSFSVMVIDVEQTEEMTYAPQNRQLFVFLSRPGAGVALQPHCIPLRHRTVNNGAAVRVCVCSVRVQTALQKIT